MIKLKNVRCNYLGENQFDISWDTSEMSCSNVMIFEVNDDVADNKIYTIDQPSVEHVAFQTQRKVIYAKQNSEHCFIVIGFDSSESTDSSSIIQWCNSVGLNNISVRGVSFEGTLYYEMNRSNNIVDLSLTPETDMNIPKGYIYYSYEYCGKKFEYEIPDFLCGGCEKKYSIIVPNNSISLTVFQKGSRISVQEKQYDQPIGLLEKFLNLFRR